MLRARATKPGESPRPASIARSGQPERRTYLADRPVICSVVGSLKLPLPPPFMSEVFIAYCSVA